jgi:hypothetical protein
MALNFKITLISLVVLAVSIYFPITYLEHIMGRPTDLIVVYTPLNEVSLLKNSVVSYEEFLELLQTKYGDVRVHNKSSVREQLTKYLHPRLVNSNSLFLIYYR